eukprot:COSAG01_NODE_5659_length_4114_cov_12.053051_1_plen_53_part_00
MAVSGAAHPGTRTPLGKVWSSSPARYQKHESMCAVKRMTDSRKKIESFSEKL